MAHPDFDVRLKREAKTSLSAYRDSSLLRKKFGESAVKLYNMVDSKLTVAELLEKLGMDEEKFAEILEFMNNNAMVSVVSAPSSFPSGGGEGGEGEKGGPENGDDAPLGEPQGGEAPDGESEPEAEPSEEQGEGEAQAEPEAPVKKSSLSPLEKVIYDKYGSSGVSIYNMIDGEKTAEEILRQTGVSEAKLVEILEFMDEKGIIKLEKPPQASEAEESEQEGKGEKGGEPAQEPRFKPMIEEEPEEKPFFPEKPTEKPKEEPKKKEEPEFAEDIVMVDVPQMERLSLMQRASVFAELATKFDKRGRDLVNLIDGQRDFVDLSLATGLSFFDIDNIAAHFGKKGILSFRQLGRDDIKKKYGDDGFAIYKRYGRDGLLLYEMIGKEPSLKDIIVKSKIEVDRAIDILVFIHKVMGLDVPIDRDLLYRQLGMRK